jgi:CHAT domain-containing protein
VCALALTPGGGDNGFLTALEVFGMRVRADIVVLSACESGAGRVARGEGTLGLVRAFLVAGSPRVLVSLWRVDDVATSDLMVRFYAALAEGKAPSAALREAQAAMREAGHPPEHWAPWVLWGVPGA